MSKYDIRRFNHESAPDGALRVVHSFLSKMEAERNPDDPLRPAEYTISNFRNFSLLTDEKAVIYFVWDHDVIVGEAFIVIGLDEENDHLLSADIQVLADHRRNGLGRALLGKVMTTAEREKRRLIMSTTDSLMPAGAAFAKRVGATVGLVEETGQLHLRDLDGDLITAWLKSAPVGDFNLLTWLGPYPVEHLEDMAALQEVMNTAPKGELDYEDEQVTPQDIRESEAYEAARGFERWTLVAQHAETGKPVGFTEVDWHPDNPQLLVQGDTVVDPRHRMSGLGRWLKANMIELVRERRSEVTHIRTENATTNQAMRKINSALGFKPYKSTIEWQLTLDAAKAYLEVR